MEDKLVSIIIPTINRKSELEILLSSIQNMTYKNFEVIIVDQNSETFIEDMIRNFKGKALHLRVNFKGVSRAKNHGMKYAKGEIVCFPDDDSEFFPESVEMGVEILSKKGVSAVFGKCVDKTGKDSVITFKKESGELTLNNHQGMFVESTMFVKKNVLEKYRYDEALGIGTFFGAEEGYDLVIRMLKNNEKIYYDPEIKIYHPQKIITHNSKSEIERVFSYRCGFGALCKKHKLYKKLIKRILKVLVALPYLYFFSRDKFRYYTAEILGILTGVVLK